MNGIFGPARAKTIFTFVAATLSAAGPAGRAAAQTHEGAVLPGGFHQGVMLPTNTNEGIALPGIADQGEASPGDDHATGMLPGAVHQKRVMLPGSTEAVPGPSAGAGCVNTAAGIQRLRIHGDQAYVSLSINRSQANMLLDTGDFVTSLTPEAVSRMNLPQSSRPKIQMTGLTGAYEASLVDAAEVQYVGHALNNLTFAVLPEGEFAPSEHTDGLFGANFLSAYDVDMDFAGKQLTFYGTSSKCNWAGPQWTVNARKYYATNIGYELLLIPILVNGVELNALVDSGSEETSITADAAARLGITKAATRHDADVTESGLGVTSSRIHVFTSITIGSTTFNRPSLAIDDGPSIQQEQNTSDATPQAGKKHTMAAILGPDPRVRRRMVIAFQRHAMFSSHAQLDVILGADFMFKKKIYLAYHQNAVFIN